MANREDEWIQILRKNIRLFNGKGWSIRGIKSGKLKKLQITHRIDDGLQHENPRESILTSIEFVQQNSPDIQTLIKDLHDLINERKVSLVEAYKITTDNSESKIKTTRRLGRVRIGLFRTVSYICIKKNSPYFPISPLDIKYILLIK